MGHDLDGRLDGDVRVYSLAQKTEVNQISRNSGVGLTRLHQLIAKAIS